MASPKFKTPQPLNINSTAEFYEMITAADTDLANPTRKIRVGSAGNLVVTRLDGTVVTIAVLAGEQLAIVAKQINAASTAGNILAMY